MELHVAGDCIGNDDGHSFGFELLNFGSNIEVAGEVVVNWRPNERIEMNVAEGNFCGNLRLLGSERLDIV